MNVWLNSIAVIIITILILYQGYRYYEYKWPERYFGPEDKTNIFISTKPYYYFIFRLLPVLVAIFVIEGTVYKAGFVLFNPILLGAITGLSFAFYNDGKAIRDLLINSPNITIFINKTLQYLLHAISIPLLLLTGCIAGYLTTEKRAQLLLPNIDGLIDNIWASFLTVIIAFYFLELIKKPKEIKLEEVIEKNSRKINQKIIKHIEDISTKYNADPILVKSVCIAENIERPRWSRIIESCFGCIKRRGTYGIMQVKSNKPITDEQSVNIAVKNYFKGSKGIDFDSKIKQIRKYNDSDKYVNLVEEIYRYMTIKTSN